MSFNDTFHSATTEPSAPSDAHDRSMRRPRRFWRLALDVLHDVAIAVIVVVLLVTYVGQAFRVKGTSMQPLLENGERIIVEKLSYRLGPIRRGDVVVFWYPRDPKVSFIKRVVALPGDTLEIREGVLYINGERLREEFLRASFRDDESLGPMLVESGHYYVMGDHRNGSNDSRSWGEVPEKYIYGKAFLRFWPPSRFGPIG